MADCGFLADLGKLLAMFVAGLENLALSAGAEEVITSVS
jgi:hypothetical protein